MMLVYLVNVMEIKNFMVWCLVCRFMWRLQQWLTWTMG